MSARHLLKTPLRFSSKVAKGFGRGDRLLGFPTANLEESHELISATSELEAGVYCGWATLQNTDVASPDEIFKTAINIGYNPTYRGKYPLYHKMVEPHLIHDFGEGVIFNGAGIRLLVAGHLRPEINFRFNTEELHSAIAKDVTEAAALLDDPVFQDILGAHKDFLLHGEA
eukprot:INCI9280.1.p1 GENE.INCI9280.1~~INCI9280.1.p1  ORF type:complete len:171 (+),score=30.54 INCI9280.1:91-603(+)